MFNDIIFQILFAYGIIFCGILLANGIEENNFLVILMGLVPIFLVLGTL